MHKITIVEFPSHCAAESAEFLGKVFGWTSTPYGPEYTDVQGGGVNLGFQQDPQEQPSAPLVVVQVENLDETQARITAAGGTITHPPFSFPGGRRFHFQEPGGNELAAWVPE